MRITNKVLSEDFLKNLSKNLNQMQKYQNQLSSGKEVSRPSDNPLLVAKIMNMNNNILQNEQYNSNISDTLSWVKTQDTALGDATQTLQRINDLVIYGSNGALSDLDRSAIVEEVKMKSEELVDILNTNFDGRYIFGGQKTTEKPFSKADSALIDDVLVEVVFTYNGDKNDISREISQGVEVNLISDGSKIIGEGTENENLGVLLKKVIDALDAGASDILTGDDGLLGDLQKATDNVVRIRTQIGAIHNRLEAAEDRNKAENINLKELLSEREDIDIIEKYMEYMVMATTYQASLSVGAKILQPSLLDYLG